MCRPFWKSNRQLCAAPAAAVLCVYSARAEPPSPSARHTHTNSPLPMCINSLLSLPLPSQPLPPCDAQKRGLRERPSTASSGLNTHSSSGGSGSCTRGGREKQRNDETRQFVCVCVCAPDRVPISCRSLFFLFIYLF